MRGLGSRMATLRLPWAACHLGLLFAAISFALLPGRARAARIAVFDNPTYVDTTSRDPSAESDNVQAVLSWLGHRVITFTAVDAEGMRAGLSGVTVAVIPELERQDLVSELSEDARDALREFVGLGRELIVHGTSDRRASDLLNVLFGWRLTTGTVGNATLGPDAPGTAFAGAPGRISANQRTRGIDLTSLPADASIYYVNRTRTPVVAFSYGRGRVLYLGWDWYRGVPLGDRDGGWLKVLVAAIGDEAECRATDDDSDRDRNGIADECEEDDSCADVEGRRRVARGSWLELTNLRQRVFRDFFLSAAFWLPTRIPFESLDPTRTPFVLSVLGSNGEPRIAQTFPTSKARSGAGWRFIERGGERKWVFEDPSGSTANGFVRVVIRDLSIRSPGLVRVRVIGEGGAYAIRESDVPLALQIVFGDAEQGECAEGEFFGRACTFGNRGTSLLCKL